MTRVAGELDHGALDGGAEVRADDDLVDDVRQAAGGEPARRVAVGQGGDLAAEVEGIGEPGKPD